MFVQVTYEIAGQATVDKMVFASNIWHRLVATYRELVCATDNVVTDETSSTH